MAFCNNCGKQIPDTAKFCPYCGGSKQEWQPEPIESPPVETTFTDSTPADSFFTESVPTQLITEPTKTNKLLKLFKNKAVLYGCIGVGAALLIAVLFCIYWFFLRPTERSDAYAMYLQNSQLFLTNVADGDAIALSDANVASDYLNLVSLSDDHTLAFFPREIDPVAKTFSLCYRHVNTEGESPITLDQKVVRYTLVEGGQFPVYLTSDHHLYYHGLSIRRPLAKEVADFYAAEDASVYYYISVDQKLYYILHGEEPAIMDGGVSEICHVSEDHKTIHYLKGTALYRRKLGGDAELISENCLSFKGILANGDIIYLRAAEGDKSYYTFINDTTAAADSALQEPQAPIAPIAAAYPDETAFAAAMQQYQQDLITYQTAHQQYTQQATLKSSRDQMREALCAETPQNMQASLCVYKNGTETMLSESCSDVSVFEEQNAYFYQCYPQDAIAKKDLSDFTDTAGAKEAIDAAIAETTQWFVSVGDRSTQIHAEKAAQFSITTINGEPIVYYVSGTDGNTTLCRFPLSEGAATVYADQVQLYLHEGDNVAYLRNEYSAQFLCCNEEVLTDSQPSFWFILPDGVCYLHNGTLYTHQNGSTTELTTSVDKLIPVTDGYKYVL